MLFKGGGRSSARETIGRVAPGALAKKILKQFAGTEVCLLYEFANGIALNVSIYIELFIFLLTFCLFFLTSVLSILVYPCNEDVLSKNRINPIFYRCTLLFHICFWTCLCLSLFFFCPQILAYVSQVHQVVLPEDLVDHENLTLEQVRILFGSISYILFFD